ncbi:four-carbon acid sugar kinase family protein [Thioalkalivibrio sulfidiphilus]|uniref:four-carbon acid sugar kinase family protein n=1 Tax=Thioalkalivibrio sulfidiphilus TaxID=1033854 RepID=UPI003B321383
MSDTKIIALDDDPTGSQTVHSCLLLTRWDVATLRQALRDASPIFFVLTNTRGMDARRAAQITREVCANLRQAQADEAAAGHPVNPVMVSRSDSTLRGHYPVETDVIAEAMGPFDAHFLVPAFIEAGRITRDSVHYVVQDGKPVPAHETEFARDSVFAYQHSYLPDYVAEKTRGRIPAETVVRITFADLRGDVTDRLMALEGNACAAVDAQTQADLERFADAVLTAAARGKRFLFRSAASLLTALARLPAQPVPAEAMSRYVRGGRPGAVIVGSHVKKTTQQLHRLLETPGTAGVEIDVNRLPGERDAVLRETLAAIQAIHERGDTPVVYTSRAERQFPDQQTRLAFGEQVSALLMDVVRGLPADIGYLISKGGITSNDTLSTGLALATSRVLGQILTGCSVVRCPDDHPRFPGLPVVIFPGNVGDEHALAEAYRRLALPGDGHRHQAAG